MKQFLIILTAIFSMCAIAGLTSCSSEEETVTPDAQNDPIIEAAEIPFTGNWTRQFEAGPGNLHTVQYAVYQDSIRYTISGPIGNADYVMIRDTFLMDDFRYVGHTPEAKHYLVLVKNVSDSSMTLYKQEVMDMEEALGIPVPASNTTANHGWNTYQKQ